MTRQRICRTCGLKHACDLEIGACRCLCGSQEIETFWPDLDERVRVLAFPERETGVGC